jgi:hypothetical protein
MRYSPWQEPWWNAGRRARPTADGSAQADLIRGAAAPAGAEVVEQRLPAFRFLIFFRSFASVKRKSMVFASAPAIAGEGDHPQLT